MCAIFFAYSPNPHLFSDVSIELLKLSMNHRGPDGFHHYYPNDNTIIAHSRLAIRGLAGGTQPFYSDNVFSVINGEIYNYKSLPVTYNYDLGDCYSLHSLIVNNNLKSFKPCLPHIEGMFASISYFKDTNRLFAAIDTFGQKPLYYYFHDKLLICASEISIISGFLEQLGRQLQVNPEDYSNYLLHRFHRQNQRH